MQSLVPVIASQLGLSEQDGHCRPVAGGDINQAMHVRLGTQDYFLKVHPGGQSAMFQTETDALRELAASQTVRVPNPVLTGQHQDTPYCLLEWLELRPRRALSDASLGRELARLHQAEMPFFGWHCDNFIGATTQPNARESSWSVFFREQRIGYQLDLLRTRGASGRLLRSGRELMDRIDELLGGHLPHPALLHGDLWAGNAAMLEDGSAVVFDPASYYGCRETDLAMTRLFGGFGRDFYAAYEDQFPLPPDHQQRLPLYQLYHVLNHANLFGGGYLDQAERLMLQLNAA